MQPKLSVQAVIWTIRHSINNSVNCDRPGECSPEKDCLRWHWLTFRQPERKSSSESSELWIVSRCYMSLVVVLIGRRSRDVICLSVLHSINLFWLFNQNCNKILEPDRFLAALTWHGTSHALRVTRQYTWFEWVSLFVHVDKKMLSVSPEKVQAIELFFWDWVKGVVYWLQHFVSSD